MRTLTQTLLFGTTRIVDRVFKSLRHLPKPLQPAIERAAYLLSLRRVTSIDSRDPLEVGWKYERVLETAIETAMNNKKLAFDSVLAFAGETHGLPVTGMSDAVKTVLLTALYRIVIATARANSAKANS